MSKTEKQKSIPASSIKSLDGASPEFELPAFVPRVGRPDLEVVLKVRGMRKSEWAALRDEHMKMAREGATKDEKAEFSFLAMVENSSKDAACLICKAVAGWQFDEEVTPANLEELEDIAPGAMNVFLQKIDAALFNGRLGN